MTIVNEIKYEKKKFEMEKKQWKERDMVQCLYTHAVIYLKFSDTIESAEFTTTITTTKWKKNRPCHLCMFLGVGRFQPCLHTYHVPHTAYTQHTYYIYLYLNFLCDWTLPRKKNVKKMKEKVDFSHIQHIYWIFK